MIKQIIKNSIEVKLALIEDTSTINAINLAIEKIINCFKNQHSVWLCGNGGSAADAQHIAAELSGRFYFNRPALPAESFSANTSHITAVANDFGYNEIFARSAQAHCKKNDILIGISTSGNSENVLNAIKAAKKNGAITIALLGKGGGEIAKNVDIPIIIKSDDTPRIQETHILIGHIICEMVEAGIFNNQ